MATATCGGVDDNRTHGVSTLQSECIRCTIIDRVKEHTRELRATSSRNWQETFGLSVRRRCGKLRITCENESAQKHSQKLGSSHPLAAFETHPFTALQSTEAHLASSH